MTLPISAQSDQQTQRVGVWCSEDGTKCLDTRTLNDSGSKCSVFHGSQSVEAVETKLQPVGG